MSNDTPPMPAKRGRGRPPFVPAPTFDEAMAALKPAEAQYVRHVLAGDTQAIAYAKAYPGGRSMSGRQVNSTQLTKRSRVAHALALGREAGAVTAIAGLAYDTKAAHQELCDRIEAADKVGQHNAVASMLKLKLALHKLDQPTAQAVQGVQIILQTADGEIVRSFGTPAQPVATVQPIPDEETIE